MDTELEMSDKLQKGTNVIFLVRRDFKQRYNCLFLELLGLIHLWLSLFSDLTSTAASRKSQSTEKIMHIPFSHLIFIPSFLKKIIDEVFVSFCLIRHA